jgi:hypothetical protein|tara:strand:- start:168 stop:500 length:333 start_codon:yes stop_codon:yes gene_type:complete
VIKVLAIDIIENLHLSSLCRQAHFPMSINWNLMRLWISRKVFGLRLAMFINALVEHPICLCVTCLPYVRWRNFNLVEIIVSIMVALRTSFVKAIQFCTVHGNFIFATIRS